MRWLLVGDSGTNDGVVVGRACGRERRVGRIEAHAAAGGCAGQGIEPGVGQVPMACRGAGRRARAWGPRTARTGSVPLQDATATGMLLAQTGLPKLQETKVSDNKQKAGGSDRRRIDVNEDYELNDWARKFGVTKDQLKAAVQAAGTDASKVEQHLKQSSPSRGARSSDKPSRG
jgi:hypothetical protein